MERKEIINQLENVFMGDEMDLLQFLLEEISEETLNDLLKKVKDRIEE